MQKTLSKPEIVKDLMDSLNDFHHFETEKNLDQKM